MIKWLSVFGCILFLLPTTACKFDRSLSVPSVHAGPPEDISYSDEIFEIVNTEDQKIHVDPGSYSSWHECLSHNSKNNIFVMKPGDYRPWGIFKPSFSGSARNRKIVINEMLFESRGRIRMGHPYHYNSDDAVILASFILTDVKSWGIIGITFESRIEGQDHFTGGTSNMIRDGANDNIINFCVIRNVYHGSGIRILNSSSNVVQNCVFVQDSPWLTGDNVAILISAHSGRYSDDNIIRRNEIKNWNDGIAILRQTRSDKPQLAQTGLCSGTLIEDNDIYIDSLLYRFSANSTYACAENAIDLKQGGITAKPTIIKNNKMWGFRYSDRECGTSGSSGAAMIFHRNARNIISNNNIIFDSPLAIQTFTTNPSFPGEKVENILVENNIMVNIRRSSEYFQSGTAVYIGGSIALRNNFFINVNRPLFIAHPSAKYELAGNNYIFCAVKSEKKRGIPGPIIEKGAVTIQDEQKRRNRSLVKSWKKTKILIKQWTDPTYITLEGLVENTAEY